jgi:hypothetical protein
MELNTLTLFILSLAAFSCLLALYSVLVARSAKAISGRSRILSAIRNLEVDQAELGDQLSKLITVQKRTESRINMANRLAAKKAETALNTADPAEWKREMRRQLAMKK